MRVVQSPDIEAVFPGIKRARVIVRLEDGASFTEVVDAAKGEPDNPMSDDELAAKFESNAGDALTDDGVDDVIAATRELESLRGIGELMELIGSRRRRA